MKRIGSRTYSTEREAAKAYDRHVYNELGYKAVLNFDAEVYEVKASSLYSGQAGVANCLLTSLICACLL